MPVPLFLGEPVIEPGGLVQPTIANMQQRKAASRFVRIGMTPTWSLEGARRWAKELRSAVDRGGDPESYNRERQKIKPVESFIRFNRREPTVAASKATVQGLDR